MEYQGLIPEVQQPVKQALPHWRYGTIENGVKVIDPLLHYGCFTMGYEQNNIVDKVSNVVKNVKPEIAEVVGYGDIRLNQVSFQLQEKLYSITGYHSFYALSGSDANEGAVKLASAYHHNQGNLNKKKILSFKPGYHGSTFLTSSLACDTLMDDPFYTMEKYQGTHRVDRNFDADSINWDEFSAIMVETCSYGNHLTPYTDEFWRKLTRIQNNHNVLIIIDDIFMGGGKTGNYVGWKHLPIVPDIFTMGKAVTAGFFPLSMTFYNEKVKNSLPKNFKWEHGFTYNFSIPGVVSALEYIDIVQKLLPNVPNLISIAKKTFIDCGCNIVNSFGTYFLITKGKYQTMYMIPLNADQEYFDVLKQNLMVVQ